MTGKAGCKHKPRTPEHCAAISRAHWRRKRRTYTDDELVALHDAGYSRSAIAEKLGCGMTQVTRVLLNHNRALERQPERRAPRQEWSERQWRSYARDILSEDKYREWNLQMNMVLRAQLSMEDQT